MELIFLFKFRCTRESVDAMKHYMEVARRCYEQGRGVMQVTLEMIDPNDKDHDGY